MRVAFVNQDAGIGPQRHKGAAVHLTAMREAMAGRGAEVVAVDEAREPALLARLEALVAEGPIDLLYERYALGRHRAACFANERGVPMVLEVNAPLADEARRWRRHVESADERARDRFLFAHADGVFAVSRPVADYARSRGADPARIRVVPNGVDTARFVPRAGDDPLRATLVPPGRLAIGFHGRLRPWHGFERLVDACARLLQRGVPVHLVAVGEGPFAETVAGRLDVRHVTLVGWREHAEVARHVAVFDVLPLPYDPAEPCYFSPLKLAEAMACGVVPVVPALGDLPAAVRDGVDGLVVPAGDSDALVAAVERLYRRPALRRRLARAAVATAGRHSWRHIADLALAFARERGP